MQQVASTGNDEKWLSSEHWRVPRIGHDIVETVAYLSQGASIEGNRRGKYNSVHRYVYSPDNDSYVLSAQMYGIDIK